jgi:hypothetical protein
LFLAAAALFGLSFEEEGVALFAASPDSEEDGAGLLLGMVEEPSTFTEVVEDSMAGGAMADLANIK